MRSLLVLGLLIAPLGAQESQKVLNADVMAARSANKETRYLDAEALMLKDTAASPSSSIMWMELGAAELGLKKYAEAEATFKRALGIDTGTLQAIHKDDFYSDAHAGATQMSRNTAEHTIVSNDKLNPEIKGVAYSDLGEVYARTKRPRESQDSWDLAVKANPSKASLYLGNETIIFFQEGDSEAQVAAAEKAIAADPTRAALYYFKGQGLSSKATVDPQTQRLIPPPGCIEAYRKYLELEPKGKFSEEARQMVAAASVAPK